MLDLDSFVQTDYVIDRVSQAALESKPRLLMHEEYMCTVYTYGMYVYMLI